MRSNFVGDCGIAARTAYWARDSLSSSTPEVAERGGLHAVALVAVEVRVEVGLHDPLLAGLPREGLGQADRLDDLADLAVVDGALERVLREESRTHELLGDRRCASGAAGERVEPGGDDRADVEARVGPEILVLDRSRRVDHLARDVSELDELSAEHAEAGQLDRACPVVNDRRLLEGDSLKALDGIRQALAVVGVGADDRDEANPAEDEEAREQEEGDGERRASGGATSTSAPGGTVPAVSLTPLEGGLHEAATIP